jgi:DNA-damage-inducible protein D
MKATWNVPDNRPLADFAPTIVLKAKDFATEITIFNSREHGLATEQQISNDILRILMRFAGRFLSGVFVQRT